MGDVNVTLDSPVLLAILVKITFMDLLAIYVCSVLLTTEIWPLYYIVCTATDTCNNNGQCDENTGECKCNIGFEKPNCGHCQTGLYGANCSVGKYKLCFNVTTNCWKKECNAQTTCNGNGTCNPTNGNCECSGGFDGATCSHCKENLYGPQCNTCMCNSEDEGERDTAARWIFWVFFYTQR